MAEGEMNSPETATSQSYALQLERQLEQITNLLFEFVPFAQYAEAAEEYERIIGKGAISRRVAAILKVDNS